MPISLRVMHDAPHAQGVTMNASHQPMVAAPLAALILALAPLAASAQGASPPAPAASAPQAAASAPRTAKQPSKLMSPEESRDTAQHDLLPERQVTPQINIPLNKKGDVPEKPYGYTKSRKAGKAGGGIDDAAARCQAQANAQARAACLDKLAQEPSK